MPSRDTTHSQTHSSNMKQTDEGIIKNSYELIIKELQTLMSISYIIAVGIGMLFSFQKYHRFGINILDYADVFDFLIAPFSDVKVLLFSLVSIFFGIALIRFDVIGKKSALNLILRLIWEWIRKNGLTQ